MLLMEHVAQQRQGGGHQGRAGDAQQRAGGDQHFRAGGEGRQRRSGTESGGAGQQQFTPTDAVTQRAHGHQKAGDHETVDVENPQQLITGGVQVRAQLWYRQMQHGHVQGQQHRGQHQHRQTQPLTPRGGGW